MRRAAITLHGEPYWLDVSVCNRALVKLQVEGAVRDMQDLADKAGVSRSTVSRFFNAWRGGCSVTTVKAVLRVLGLRFEDVVTPREEAHEVGSAVPNLNGRSSGRS